MDFSRFCCRNHGTKNSTSCFKTQQIGFEAGSRIIFIKSEVFGFTPHVAISERYSIFTLHFAFNDPMDKSEHLIGF
jgi:hypothetical protein